ncbi:glycosyl hydrolase family 18 protein [Cytobacillus sp. IB215665]|uniref:glycosyl hydrolase family 18 protein n=1 Tax=Cytobacillus sp. IB215665 TaxID=3097357 RepID=UPI002A163EC0|nr:glycosyl hydrolase family 18 protein [Cytobacillus sp. IB215665]MDX8363791.1 glycosyl hydrolase family 18 protein [Cytobacillus sp. IB215665]
MIIYTVKQGDSLYSIGQKFRASYQDIMRINGLENGNIVPGQSLLIQQNVYIVQQGDTLYKISEMTNVSTQALIDANQIQNPNMINPGMQLTLPNIPGYSADSVGYESIITADEMGYVTLRDPIPLEEELTTFAPWLNYVPLFDYQLQEGGNLSDLDDESAIRTARENRIAPLATVTAFNADMIHRVLSSAENTQRLIDNIYQIVSSKNYSGVNIDFEAVTERDRDSFSEFCRLLNDRMKTDGYLTTIAVLAKESEAWHKGLDYQAIAPSMDFVFIMAYDWHWRFSQPGPIAPINRVRIVLDFAITQIPRNKIVLGTALYGYDWTVPFTQGMSARALSSHAVTKIAMQYQIPIRYDVESASPWIEFVDEENKRRIVWFEDVKSINEKFKLVREYGLGGVGFWQLRLEFPQLPTLMSEMFTVEHIL